MPISRCGVYDGPSADGFVIRPGVSKNEWVEFMERIKGFPWTASGGPG